MWSLPRTMRVQLPSPPPAIPRVKEQSNLPKLALKQRYAKALKGLEDGSCKSLASAAQANDLSKLSLGWSIGERPTDTAGSASRTANILPGGQEGNGEVDIEVR